MIISEPGGNSRAWPRFENSCVVDGPMTGYMTEMSAFSRCDMKRHGIPISLTSAFIYVAAASMPASYRSVVSLATWYVAPSWTFVDIR